MVMAWQHAASPTLITFLWGSMDVPSSFATSSLICDDTQNKFICLRTIGNAFLLCRATASPHPQLGKQEVQAISSYLAFCCFVKVQGGQQLAHTNTDIVCRCCHQEPDLLYQWLPKPEPGCVPVKAWLSPNQPLCRTS